MTALFLSVLFHDFNDKQYVKDSVMGCMLNMGIHVNHTVQIHLRQQFYSKLSIRYSYKISPVETKYTIKYGFQNKDHLTRIKAIYNK